LGFLGAMAINKSELYGALLQTAQHPELFAASPMLLPFLPAN